MCIPALCFSILLLLLPQSGLRASIVGEWERVVKTERTDPEFRGAEIRTRWQFRRDGTLVRTLAIEAHGNYRVDGTHLISVLGSGSEAVTEDQEFRIEGNIFILKFNGKEELRLERRSSPAHGASRIVGAWSMKAGFFHQENSTLEFVFTEDGRITMKMQTEPYTSRYKIKNSLLTVSPGIGAEEYKVRLENGFLFLIAVGGDGNGDGKYTRVR